MPITTSYFAVSKHLNGTKISIARYNPPWVRANIDECIVSFAPSSELLKRYKDGELNWEQYKNEYHKEQRFHYRHNPEDFDNLLERSESDEVLVLLCYEKFEGPRTKCHRFLLYDLLKKVSDNEGYETEFFDERPYKRI